MISKTTKRFREALADLPTGIQRQAREAYKRFSKNPYHPGLRFKKVHSTEPIYAARINDDDRALGLVEDGEIVWFWIVSHAEYEKMLGKR